MNIIVSILISGLSAALSFIMTNNYLVMIIVLALFMIYFIFYEFAIHRKIKKEESKNDNFNAFMHAFLNSYLSNNNLDEALEVSYKDAGKDLTEQIKMTTQNRAIDSLSNLKTYFNKPLFNLLVNAVDSNTVNYETLNYIAEENNRRIKNRTIFNHKRSKYYREFLILWLISFAVLLVVRFAIDNQFNAFVSNKIYIIGVLFYFGLLLISFIGFNYFLSKGVSNE